MIAVEISGETLTLTVDYFDQLSERIYNSLVSAIIDVIRELKNLVVLGYLSGQVLKQVSGRLASSIAEDIEQTADAITGKVVQRYDLAPYGHVHEQGGSFIIPAHIRHLKNGREVAVSSYIMEVPRRSFMEAALQELAERIKDRLVSAVRGAL